MSMQSRPYLDLGLDVLDGVRGLHLEGDGLAREGLDEDLHGCAGCRDLGGKQNARTESDSSA